jgi:hypothetical protein
VLGKKRRASVRDYRGIQLATASSSSTDLRSVGKTLIDIREFYNDNGEERPGKKGISLTVQQVRSSRFHLFYYILIIASGKPSKLA